FINNPYEKLSKPFYKTQKKEKPLIGFVGNANGSLKKYVTELYFYILYTFKKLLNSIQTDSQKFYPSSIKRYYYLKKLSKSNKIETNFIFRKKYRAGIKSEAEKIKTTQEFFENLYNCPYTFCLRGAGNFSVRFYETIAMGRIPVIVKTDFRLPLNSLINWEKHCVLIEENNFIADFLQFHSNITPYDFEQMQINNLTLWKDILKRESYFITIASIFNK
ncbi:exostosin family protein, partial [Flavobacterium sp.]|uniref:exostosin domain-containing protein n=1 Tax=Flavobacterium sp. TaxID=239 RepID=UPI003751D3D6